MSNQYRTYTADVAEDDRAEQIDMLLPSDCPKYHYFSSSWNGCLPCSRLCRNLQQCKRRPECDSYRSDFMGQDAVPPWIIVVIVVVVLLVLLGISVFLAMKFKMKLCELCRGFKESKTKHKKNRFGARDGSTRSSKSLMLPPKIPIQQGYEKTPIIIDIESSRRRSMMDRFFSSIAAHPPTRGVDDMEPLRPPKPERTRPRPKEKPRRSLDPGKDAVRESEKKHFIAQKNTEDSICDICVRDPPDICVKGPLDDVKKSQDSERISVKGHLDDVKKSQDSESTTTDVKRESESSALLKKKEEGRLDSSLHSLDGWVDHNPDLPRDLTTPLDGPLPSLPILYALTRTSNPSSRNSKASLNTASVKGSVDNVTHAYPQTRV